MIRKDPDDILPGVERMKFLEKVEELKQMIAAQAEDTIRKAVAVDGEVDPVATPSQMPPKATPSLLAASTIALDAITRWLMLRGRISLPTASLPPAIVR